MEVAPTEELFERHRHPYTRALLSAVPNPNPREKKHREPLHGEVPSLLNPPAGCIFHQRCPYAEERCRQEKPTLEAVGDQHRVACHRRLDF